MNTDNVVITRAEVADAAEILALQKLAYRSEAALYDDYTIPPLTQTLEEIRQDFKDYTVLKAAAGGVIVGSVRGRESAFNEVYIGRLFVHPDRQKQGIGSRLMGAVEAAFPRARRFWLGTGHLSADNIRLYNKLGYRECGREPQGERVIFVHLEKLRA